MLGLAKWNVTGKAYHLGKEKVEQMVTPCSSL